MSGYSRGGGGGDEYGSSGYSNDSGRSGGGGRSNYDSNSGQKRNYSDQNSRGSHGSGGGYNRSRSDNDDSGHNRGRNDDNRGRNDHQSHSSSGGGDDSRMETQYDTIFIQNLPRNVTPSELKDVFSQIGIIKNDKKTGAPKIWIYKDKTTGEGKGEATITYEDDAAAQAAISWYNGKEVLSNIVQVSLATRRASAFGGRGGFRGGRGRGGGDFGGYRGRGGDRGNDYRSGGGEYRGSGRGASHGSSRDNRSNPY